MSLTAEQKLKFIHSMTKLAMDKIPHYDLGGLVGGGGLGAIVNPAAAIPGAILGAGGVGDPLKDLGLINHYSPGSAAITPGTNAEQLGTAYTGAQGAIANQQGLVKQTQPGVAQGLGAQSTLSGQLANEAAGVGPNPAQAALNQSTGRNINAQAALQASQRGASANPGAVAAEAARTGSDIQQQAVGQSATLQAQQQIAAQQQAAQLAAQQVAQGAGAIGGENQAIQNEQGILQGANTAANNAAVGQQSGINNVNAQVAGGNQKQVGNIVGGLLGGASSVLGSLFAEGGEVHKMADGGYMAPMPLVVAPMNAPQSFVGQYLNSGQAAGAKGPDIQNLQLDSSSNDMSENASKLGSTLGGFLKSGPEAPTGGYAGSFGENPMGSPIEMVAAKGGKVKKSLPMMGKNERLISKGGKVKPGDKSQKAVSSKDDYANDKVPALLSEGEVVMDKDTLSDPGPIGQMARAVAHHIETRNAKGRKHV